MSMQSFYNFVFLQAESSANTVQQLHSLRAFTTTHPHAKFSAALTIEALELFFRDLPAYGQ